MKMTQSVRVSAEKSRRACMFCGSAAGAGAASLCGAGAGRDWTKTRHRQATDSPKGPWARLQTTSTRRETKRRRERKSAVTICMCSDRPATERLVEMRQMSRARPKKCATSAAM